MDWSQKSRTGSGCFSDGQVAGGQWGSGCLGAGVGNVVKLGWKIKVKEERLKLLQEAAILGQFRHNHIIDLVGVVTTDEPVS